MKLSERIRRWRESRDLTVPELAAQLNVHPEAVYQWESGATSPTYTNLDKAVAAFGIDLPTFWGTPPRARKAKAS